MKKIYLFLLTFVSFTLLSNDLYVANAYALSFKKAYQVCPSIPNGVLESVAFTQSRFEHLGNQEPSCIGYPTTYGVMGAIENGKGYFTNNLLYISQL